MYLFICLKLVLCITPITGSIWITHNTVPRIMIQQAMCSILPKGWMKSCGKVKNHTLIFTDLTIQVEEIIYLQAWKTQYDYRNLKM